MNKNIIYYVYKHTFPNNKVYIGITCRTLEERWGTEWKRGKLLSEKEKMRYQKVEVEE